MTPAVYKLYLGAGIKVMVLLHFVLLRFQASNRKVTIFATFDRLHVLLSDIAHNYPDVEMRGC